MDCLHPRDLKLGFPVPCGKCIACRSRQRNQWVIRLEEELKHSSSCIFVTLTYDDDHYTLGNKGFPVLSKRDVQLFLKRLRKKLGKDKIRYFICGEYGPTTLRPHYHGLIFNIPQKYDIQNLILDSWLLGFVKWDYPTPARIRYVAKYCLSAVSDSSRDFEQFKDYLAPQERPFMLSSRRPGIGASFLTPERVNYHRETLDSSYIRSGGYKVALPRYYRDKMFDDVMKFELFNNFKNERKIEFERRQKCYADDFIRNRKDFGLNIFLPVKEEDIDYLYHYPEAFTEAEAEFWYYVADQELQKHDDYVRRVERKHKESGKL